jgi:GPN-loop GTPase
MNLPHLNVLTKCDKITNKEFLEKVAEAPSCKSIVEDQMDEQNFFSAKFRKLNEHIIDIVDNFSLVNFVQLDIANEESINDVIT